MLPEVVLGFLEEPQNKVIMEPKMTPSKAGGEPSWICPVNQPTLKCDICGYYLTFLLQLYANID
jgi:hypothetical protein